MMPNTSAFYTALCYWHAGLIHLSQVRSWRLLVT